MSDGSGSLCDRGVWLLAADKPDIPAFTIDGLSHVSEDIWGLISADKSRLTGDKLVVGEACLFTNSPGPGL